MLVVSMRTCIVAGAIAAFCGTPPLRAQDSVPPFVAEHYIRQDVMIPMRDGVRLFTIMFRPRDSSVAYPILLSRTPYGANTFLHPLGPGPTFAEAGFIFAFQDVRGKFRSEGSFIDVPPFHATRRSVHDVDEASDAYDTIDWLVKNVPHNNGRVGQYGISYLGYYSTMGILSGHPALKAVSPQAPVTDWFVGDDFHHNGALFLIDAFDFLPNFGFPRGEPTADQPDRFHFPRPDAYAYLRDAVGPVRRVNERLLRHQVPFWDSLTAHPTYDAFWKARTPLPYLRDVKPAVMTVGGWFDAEDLWGTLAVYRTIERQNPGVANTLVIGPWFHGGWFLSDGHDFADLRFPTKTAEDFHDQVELPFFEHYLKGKEGPTPPEAFVYEIGANRWRRFDHWPPPGVTERTFELSGGQRLASSAPVTPAPGTKDRGAYDEFVSDPRKPVPYIDGTLSERVAEYMAADQRFAARRPDVLVYETEALTEPLTIAGPITAHLFVSTSGTDADWVVKVIDVYPDSVADPIPNPRQVHLGGYQQLVRAEVMRGKFRNSLERPEPFVPNQVTRVELTLPDAFHTFAPGHRMMVQIQSSWFPLVDRNPQTFTDIYQAVDSDFHVATHRVFRSGASRSRLTFTVLPSHQP